MISIRMVRIVMILQKKILPIFTAKDSFCVKVVILNIWSKIRMTSMEIKMQETKNEEAKK